MRIVKGSWKIPIGRTYHGRTVLLDLDFAPHTKIAGITGSGKSEAMKSLLFFLCHQLSPAQLEIHIIDLKGGATFAQFEMLPHVRGVYRDTYGALAAMTHCAEVMWERLDEIRRNRMLFQDTKRYPMLLCLIDEGGELSPADAIGEEKKMRETCMDLLSSLVRVGREPGLRVVYGTQRPDRYTLPMTIRSQLENVMCFRVREKYDSEIVLGHEGAETLPKIPGRMLFQSSPHGEIPVQGVYVPQHIIEAWLRSYSDTNKVETMGGIESTPSTQAPSGVWGG